MLLTLARLGCCGVAVGCGWLAATCGPALGQTSTGRPSAPFRTTLATTQKPKPTGASNPAGVGWGAPASRRPAFNPYEKRLHYDLHRPTSPGFAAPGMVRGSSGRQAPSGAPPGTKAWWEHRKPAVIKRQNLGPSVARPSTAPPPTSQPPKMLSGPSDFKAASGAGGASLGAIDLSGALNGRVNLLGGAASPNIAKPIEFRTPALDLAPLNLQPLDLTPLQGGLRPLVDTPSLAD